MATVIDRAVRMLQGLEGVVFDVGDDRIDVPPASPDGFLVRLRMINDRTYVVEYDGWRHEFDRAEDAYDCFEHGLSDSCRLRITLRGDVPVAWHAEKREYGMWVPANHRVRRRLVPFWRRARVVYRQNQWFRRAT
jgi:hypothetical protein